MPRQIDTRSIRFMRWIPVALFITGLGLVCGSAWNQWLQSVSIQAASLRGDSIATAQVRFGSQRNPVSAIQKQTRPIELLAVGERVLAVNPEVSAEERAAYVEPDWSGWVHLSLEMPKPDGYVLHIEMLRPESWVRSQLAFVTAKRETSNATESSLNYPTDDTKAVDASKGNSSSNEGTSAEDGPSESLGFLPYRKLYLDLAATSVAIETESDEVIGAVVELDLPELGLTGPAIIKNIETAPEVKRGEGRVITATFHHSSGDVIDLVVGDDNSTETLGTTSNHPFWSVDRQEYVQAGSLHQGERVLTLHGDTKRIVSHYARPGPQPVFNLEVFAEHVYYVGGDGLLVHNSETYDISDGIGAVSRKGGSHGKLSAARQDLGSDIELHHLNQDGIYGKPAAIPGNTGSIIPYASGAVAPVRGRVLAEGSQHNILHVNIEKILDDSAEIQRITGRAPTNGQYGEVVYRSLRQAGFSPRDAYRYADSARRQRISHGHLDDMPIPRYSNPIPNLPGYSYSQTSN